MSGLDRQRAVFLAGAAGRRTRVPVDFASLEERAREAMSEQAFAYVAGGAAAEVTMRANREAFERVSIVPRTLRDVSQRDASVELLGRRLPAPFLLAPIGVLDLAHRGADVAAARAAASLGIPAIFSSQASRPMEEVASAMGDGPRWFQLYWSTVDDLVDSFVRRAERCGCEAIVITLDTTLLGWRPRDLDLAYLPFVHGRGIAQYTSDPVFRDLVASGERERPAIRPTLTALRTLLEMRRRVRGLDARTAVQTFTRIYSRPSLEWSDVARIREVTTLPVLLKGILHPDDARRAVEGGFDGIVVSNHGGRQLDGAIATLDALPAIVDEVAGRIPVLLDSGVRTGSDVLKAIALGATAVLVGRPYVYGLAVGGESGVFEVLEGMLADFDLALGLSGCTSIEEARGLTVVAASGSMRSGTSSGTS